MYPTDRVSFPASFLQGEVIGLSAGPRDLGRGMMRDFQEGWRKWSNWKHKTKKPWVPEDKASKAALATLPLGPLLGKRKINFNLKTLSM
jgi:hypothetical protein